MKKVVSMAGIALMAISSALAQPATDQSKFHAFAEARLEQAIKNIAASDPIIPGVIAAVSAPRLGIEWQDATGTVTLGGKEPLRTTDSFRIASVTKPFVAATVIRLIEQGKFGMYDPIPKVISPRSTKALKDGGYDVNNITVYQLLTHTSGIFDTSESPAYAQAVMADPQHHWTRDEQIDFAMKYGHPVAPPGQDYNYSEGSYILLGEVIERATGKRLADAVTDELKLKQRGLNSTYWETVQPAPAGERKAHQYAGKVDITDANPSFDLYGGGGLVSTVSDLTRFIRPLLQGEMFDKKSTMAMALMVPPSANGKLSHVPLLGEVRVGKRMCWGHAGFWGVWMVYCPDNDVAIAIAWNNSQAKGEFHEPVAELGKAIDEIEAEAQKAAIAAP